MTVLGDGGGAMKKGNGEMRVLEAIAKLDRKIDDSIARLDHRIDGLDHKFGSSIASLERKMDAGFKRMDDRFDSMLKTMGARWRDHEHRLRRLERKVG
jgi:archaellum component FlaC